MSKIGKIKVRSISEPQKTSVNKIIYKKNDVTHCHLQF